MTGLMLGWTSACHANSKSFSRASQSSCLFGGLWSLTTTPTIKRLKSTGFTMKIKLGRIIGSVLVVVVVSIAVVAVGTVAVTCAIRWCRTLDNSPLPNRFKNDDTMRAPAPAGTNGIMVLSQIGHYFIVVTDEVSLLSVDLPQVHPVVQMTIVTNRVVLSMTNDASWQTPDLQRYFDKNGFPVNSAWGSVSGDMTVAIQRTTNFMYWETLASGVPIWLNKTNFYQDLSATNGSFYFYRTVQ